MADRQKPTTYAWREARPLIAAALAAQAVIAVLTQARAPAPLWTAIAATLTFAGVWHACCDSAAMHRSHNQPVIQVYATIMTGAAVLLGALLITAVVGAPRDFLCAPTIPWRIEIALFGSFAIGCLTRLAHTRRTTLLAYPLVLVSLLWIAPYYGYFNGAIFLGIGLATDCAGRSTSQVLLAAAGMIVGTVLGKMIGDWLSPAPNDSQGEN